MSKRCFNTSYVLISFIYYLIATHVAATAATAGTTTFTCRISTTASCKGKSITSTAGHSLQLKLTFANKKFSILKFHFNLTSTATITPGWVRLRNHEERLVVPGSIDTTPGSSSSSIEITLANLTLADNRATFGFEYHDADGEITWTNELIVTSSVGGSGRGSGTESSGLTIVIIIIVIAASVLLTCCVLVTLVKSGVLPLACCKAQPPPPPKVERSVEAPLRFDDDDGGGGGGDEDDKIYASPFEGIKMTPGPALTEYAVLGPGGGRLGGRNDRPPKSNYAQVKTEEEEEYQGEDYARAQHHV